MGFADEISRRDVLRAGLGAAASLAAGWTGFPQEPKEKYMFNLGVQSYCFRDFGWEPALGLTKELGLAFWEAYPGHIPLTAEASKVNEYLAAMKKNGVTLRAYGVVGMSEEREHNRLFFQFAKQMGVNTLTADPKREALGQIGELADEFGVNVAIHNHGPGASYDKVEDVLKAVEGQPARIGACVDTGHYLRSGEDPVAAVKALGKRVHAVHLKDFVDAHTEAIAGEGKLDIKGVLGALKQNEFKGLIAVEYEANSADPMPDLKKCLANTRAAIATLG